MRISLRPAPSPWYRESSFLLWRYRVPGLALPACINCFGYFFETRALLNSKPVVASVSAPPPQGFLNFLRQVLFVPLAKLRKLLRRRFGLGDSRLLQESLLYLVSSFPELLLPPPIPVRLHLPFALAFASAGRCWALGRSSEGSPRVEKDAGTSLHSCEAFNASLCRLPRRFFSGKHSHDRPLF